MILTGEAIERAWHDGKIVITPFHRDQLGPNSYDFCLGTRCKVYASLELDSARENRMVALPFDDDGIILDPGRLYLFNTVEVIGSTDFVPIIRGRSSVGRLGVFVHITADLIDIGSINQLTLQIHAVVPTRVYPGMRIGQVTFWAVEGKVSHYNGKYRTMESPAGSLSFRDWR